MINLLLFAIDFKMSHLLKNVAILCLAIDHYSIFDKMCNKRAVRDCVIDNIYLGNLTQYDGINLCGSTNSNYQPDISVLSYYHKLVKNFSSEQPNDNSNNIPSKGPEAVRVWAVLTVKDDSYRVIEWIIWHYILGIEHFIIHDHNSTDNLRKSLGKSFIIFKIRKNILNLFCFFTRTIYSRKNCKL